MAGRPAYIANDMEKKTEKKQETKAETKVEAKEQAPKKKTNRTWEAAMRLKGSLIVNDPKFML